MKRSLSILCLASILLVLAACRPTPAPPTATPVPPTATAVPEKPMPDETPSAPASDVLAALEDMDDHNVLVQAIKDADLAEKLKSDGPYTLFSPTDAAFDALEDGLIEDPDLLFDILLYHVVEQTLTVDEAIAQGAATSLFGDDLTFTANGDKLMVDGAAVLLANIMADNGIVHTIDAVLIPSTLGEE